METVCKDWGFMKLEDSHDESTLSFHERHHVLRTAFVCMDSLKDSHAESTLSFHEWRHVLRGPIFKRFHGMP